MPLFSLSYINMNEETVTGNSSSGQATVAGNSSSGQESGAEATEQKQKQATVTGSSEASTEAETPAQETDASAEPKNEEPKELSPEERIAALEKENAELKDQLLRRAADFDNYRKRMIKEKQDAYDYANAALLQDLLESLDNLERTIAAAENATDAKSIADGVKMISTSLMNMLENKYNLVPYGASGDAFNPEEHEALRSEQEEVESPVLKEVYLKGYKLKDRVIRNAKVSVSMPKA